MDQGQTRGFVVAIIVVIGGLIVMGAAGAGTAAADTGDSVESFSVLDIDTDTDDAETTDNGADEENGDDGADEENGDDGADEENGDDGADEENGDDGADEEGDSDDGDASDGADGDDSGGEEPSTPADLVVTDVGTNTPITVGETIEVDITIENVGGQAGSGEVRFLLDQYEKDSTTVSLDAGESTSIQLTYVSKSGDAQDWTLRVESPHDTSTRTITIEERDDSASGGSGSGSGDSDGSSSGSGGFTASASFDIQSFTVPESATAGDVIELTTTVENTGTIGSEKLVWFTVDGSTINQTEVELSRNNDQTLTYAFDTSGLTNGTYEIAVETPDGIETREVMLNHPRSQLVIENVEGETTVEAGDQLVASVDLYNGANATATDNVSLYLDDSRIDVAAVAVEPHATTTVELTYRTNAELLGDLNFTVATSESSENVTATVLEPTEVETETETPDSTAGMSSASASDDDDTEAAPETPTEPDGTDDTIPGFGITVTLAALLLALVTIFGRTRRQ